MRDLAVTLVIFGLVPICFLRPWIGVLVWYWLGIMNPHRLTYSFAFDFPFAQIVGIALLAGLLVTRDRKPIPWSRELIVMALFFIHVSVTTLFAWAPEAAWVQWNKVMKVILTTFVATMLIYGRKRIEAVLLVVALSVGFYGFQGGILSFLTGGSHMVQGPPGSFLGGNNFLGLGLAMVIPLLFILAREESRKWLKNLLYTTAWLSVVAEIFTYSRGALLGLVVVLSLLFLTARRRIIVAILAVPLVLVGKELLPEKLVHRAGTIETYEQDASSMQRIQAWNVALNIALESPFSGAGFNYESSPNDARWLSYASREFDIWGEKSRAAHSIYFQVLGQHGFFGLALFLTMLLFAYLTAGRLQRIAAKDPERMWIASYARGIRIGLIGYLVTGAFVSSAYIDLLYLYIGLLVIMAKELAQTSTVGATPSRKAGSRQAAVAGAGARLSPGPASPTHPEARVSVEQLEFTESSERLPGSRVVPAFPGMHGRCGDQQPVTGGVP